MTGTSDVARGLTASEAAERLNVVGPNEAVTVKRGSAARQIVGLLGNPLVLILLVASAIAASIGQHADAEIITTIVVLNVSITFWQSQRSQQAADRLRRSVAPTATVLRDSTWQEIPIAHVVPDDVVRLGAGDLVPADARLLESRDLSIQQSLLTGESVPADKQAIATVSADASPARDNDPANPQRVFMGTSVVSGTGIALVTATGPRTMFGDVAQRLASRPPITEFEHGLRRFSLLILRTTVALVLFILLVGIVSKRDPLESLLFAVALGVGLTPEFLPMIATITLTQGALRMAREGVIVKHLPSIQDLGSIDILCSDKTGTLTSGVMEVAAVVDAFGHPASRPLMFAGLNSQFQTGIRSPFDVAILARAAAGSQDYRKIDEVPFDFTRRRLSVVVAPVAEKDRRLLVTKGAPESILPLVVAVDVDGRVSASDEDTGARSSATPDVLSSDGIRVLAVAYRWMEKTERCGQDSERNLVLAGFVGFGDPVLPDVPALLKDLERDGVIVKIITGDNALVARHVCRTIGLRDDQIVSGEDLARLDDAALGHVAEQASLFSRVSPAQKDRIITVLKRRGHVVGYIGDGINDAPSLHTADVGISVVSAADVAREAADVVLSERTLGVLHRGILEGRRASANMMKYLLMSTSSNFGNMFSMAAAAAFLPFLPMLPTQILLNSFLYDLAQITIPTDNVDNAYLRRPQRWDMRIIRDFMVFIGPVSSVFDFLTFYVLLRVLHATEPLFHTGWFVESLATQTLVIFVIRTTGNPLTSRPSGALAATTLAIVGLGLALPATPLGRLLGFTRPPLMYFAFLVGATLAYLALVEVVKRAVVRHRADARKPQG